VAAWQQAIVKDTNLYRRGLGIEAPGRVYEVELDTGEQTPGTVTVYVDRQASAPLHCPECGMSSPGYET